MACGVWVLACPNPAPNMAKQLTPPKLDAEFVDLYTELRGGAGLSGRKAFLATIGALGLGGDWSSLTDDEVDEVVGMIEAMPRIIKARSMAEAKVEHTRELNLRRADWTPASVQQLGNESVRLLEKIIKTNIAEISACTLGKTPEEALKALERVKSTGVVKKIAVTPKRRTTRTRKENGETITTTTFEDDRVSSVELEDKNRAISTAHAFIVALIDEAVQAQRNRDRVQDSAKTPNLQPVSLPKDA